MIITLAGNPGAGKSTVAKLLAKKLNFPVYSMGDLRGKMAIDRGLTIDQLNDLGMNEKWTDTDVDTYQTKLAEQENNFIMDSWLGWFFIPQAKKIFLDVNPDIGAERIFNARKKEDRPDEPLYESIQQTKQILHDRVLQNKERYKKHYGEKADFLNKQNYDIVIDTTNITPEQAVKKIITFTQQ